MQSNKLKNCTRIVVGDGITNWTVHCLWIDLPCYFVACVLEMIVITARPGHGQNGVRLQTSQSMLRWMLVYVVAVLYLEMSSQQLSVRIFVSARRSTLQHVKKWLSV